MVDAGTEGSDGDGGFVDYQEGTMDPGASMLIATLLFCVLLMAVLPCLLALGRRFHKHEDDPCGEETESSGAEESPRSNHRKQSKTSKASKQSKKTAHASSASSSLRHTHRHPPPRTGSNLHLSPYSAHPYASNSNEYNEGNGYDDDAASIDSTLTGVSSVASAFVNAILDTSLRGGPHKRATLAKLQHRDGVIEVQNSNDEHDVYLYNNNNDGNNSVLGRLSQDEVSIGDAVDAADSVYFGNKEQHDQQNLDYRDSKSCMGSWNQLLKIAEWDYETKRICKLGLPFIIQAILEGGVEAVVVSLIGRFVGTQALAAYVVVDLAVGLTTQFLQGFQEGLTTLCSQAVGAGNRQLAGQYIQIATFMYCVWMVPLFFFWNYLIGPTLLWFGFGQETAQMGEDFTLLYMFSRFLFGVHDSVHALLDVIGLETYSTIFIFFQHMATLGGILFVVFYMETPTLQHVGVVFVSMEALALVINVAIIVCNGWFDRYLEGLIGSFAVRNRKATKLVFNTSLALSFGELLTYGEWELLTIFASHLGPAEVAAWGVLGTLWDALELVTEAVADAAEVRAAFLLGSGQPEKARMSSYKAIYLAIFVSLFITSLTFIGGESIPGWMTTDPTLQRMTADLIPLFGIGNIALTVGTMSWTLVGAQGRYRLATAAGFAGSWLVTLPLAAIFTYAMNINLQGQTAAIVIGYMVSGTINTYVLLQTDWAKLSRRVMEQNAADQALVCDDDSSSSSSSSSSSEDGSKSGIQASSQNSRPDGTYAKNPRVVADLAQTKTLSRLSSESRRNDTEFSSPVSMRETKYSSKSNNLVDDISSAFGNFTESLAEMFDTNYKTEVPSAQSSPRQTKSAPTTPIRNRKTPPLSWTKSKDPRDNGVLYDV